MLLRDLPPSSNLSLGSALLFKHRKLGQTTTSKQCLTAQPLRPPSCSPVKGRSALCLEVYYTCLPLLWLSQIELCMPQGPSEFFIAQPGQRRGLMYFFWPWGSRQPLTATQPDCRWRCYTFSQHQNTTLGDRIRWQIIHMPGKENKTCKLWPVWISSLKTVILTNKDHKNK